MHSPEHLRLNGKGARDVQYYEPLRLGDSRPPERSYVPQYLPCFINIPKTQIFPKIPNFHKIQNFSKLKIL